MIEIKEILTDIRYFKKVGESFLNSACLLYVLYKDCCDGDFINNHEHSFNFLFFQGTEIYIKSIIALNICIDNIDNKELDYEDIREKINKKLKSLDHRLDKIFNEVPDLKKNLNICKVKLERSDFTSEYYIKGKNQNIIICLKELEASRYSSLSKHKNVLTGINNINTGFIKEFRKEVDKIYNRKISKIKKSIN